MRTILISFLMLAATMPALAQNSCNIKRAAAWYTASMPGTRMADENGNPINPKPVITRFIYVEYSGSKAPDIKSITYNGAELQFSVVKLTEKTVWAGDRQINPKNSMTARKGNALLKIDLHPFDGKEMPEENCKSIVIRSRVAGRLCRYYVPAETAFATHPAY